MRAVKAVCRGEAIFSPSIAQRLIHYFAALPQTASAMAFPYCLIPVSIRESGRSSNYRHSLFSRRLRLPDAHLRGHDNKY